MSGERTVFSNKAPSRRPAAEAVIMNNLRTHLWIDGEKFWTSVPKKELETVLSYVELLEAQITALIESKKPETD